MAPGNDFKQILLNLGPDRFFILIGLGFAGFREDRGNLGACCAEVTFFCEVVRTGSVVFWWPQKKPPRLPQEFPSFGTGGLVLKVLALGFAILRLGFEVLEVGFEVLVLGFDILEPSLEVLGLGFEALGLEFEVFKLWFEVLGLRFKVFGPRP